MITCGIYKQFICVCVPVVNQQIKYIYGPVVNNKPVTCVCLPGVDVNNIIKRNNNNNHILLYKDEQHINQSIFIKLKNNPV